MKLRVGASLFLMALVSSSAFVGFAQAQAAEPKPATSANSSPGELVDRVGNTGFVQIHAESFRALSPKEQELAYWLTQAAIAIDPIIYDQLSLVWTAAEANAGRNCFAFRKASTR